MTFRQKLSKALADAWRPHDWFHLNQQVENPHLIYPGDVLSLAYGADGRLIATTPNDPAAPEVVGKRTIAEFAENEEIITMLRGMGIDYAQGYGVSEPQPVMKNNLNETTKRR